MYALLADNDWHGPGPWILLIPLFWLAVVFLVIIVLRRTVWRRGCAGRPGAPLADSPIAVLGRRYAEGDIDADEYRARRDVLTEDPGLHRGQDPTQGRGPYPSQAPDPRRDARQDLRKDPRDDHGGAE